MTKHVFSVLMSYAGNTWQNAIQTPDHSQVLMLETAESAEQLLFSQSTATLTEGDRASIMNNATGHIVAEYHYRDNGWHKKM